MSETTIDRIFYSSDFLIIFGILCLYILSGLFIYWLCNSRITRRIACKFIGIVPPFIGIPTSLFALTSAFLGVSVWQNFQAHDDAVAQEVRAISAYIQFTDTIPALQDKGLAALARDYAHSAVEIEWPVIIKTRTRSPETDLSIAKLLRQTVTQAIQPDTPPIVAQALMESVQSIISARNARLTLLNVKPDLIRWLAVLLIAFMVQLSVAIVHIDKPHPMALALSVATLSIVLILGLIGLSVQSHTGRLSVSNAPLKHISIQTRP